MTDISKITYEDYLEYQNSLMHYGVKGMKWGVRKDDRSTKSKNASANAELALNVVKPVVSLALPNASPVNLAMEIAYGKGLDTVLGTDTFSKTLLNPKRLGIGAIVAALDSGAYRVPYTMARNVARGGWNKNAELSKPNMSVKEIKEKVVSGVNPDYPGLGTTNNCMRCSYVYEMRRRGYDVSATKTQFATGQTSIEQKFVSGFSNSNRKIKSSQKKNALDFKNSAPTASDVMSTLAKEPNGSRGELQMRWGLGAGGHSVAYEIVNNKPVVIDAQTGKVYTNATQLNSLTEYAKSLNYTRLDNKPMNPFTMAAWLKDGR